jgi:hypothetical protein
MTVFRREAWDPDGPLLGYHGCLMTEADHARMAFRLLKNTALLPEFVEVYSPEPYTVVVAVSSSSVTREVAAVCLLKELWFYEYMPMITRLELKSARLSAETVTEEMEKV